MESVITRGVSRRHVRETALEAVVEAHDLKPFSFVPLRVEGLDCLDAVGLAGTEQGGKKKGRRPASRDG